MHVGAGSASLHCDCDCDCHGFTTGGVCMLYIWSNAFDVLVRCSEFGSSNQMQMNPDAQSCTFVGFLTCPHINPHQQCTNTTSVLKSLAMISRHLVPPRGFCRLLSSNSRVEEVRNAAHDRMQGRRKFYKEVTVEPVSKGTSESITLPQPTSSVVSGVTPLPEDGYCVQLDGRALKTPAKNKFLVPTLPLATAIGMEWDYQSEYIIPNSMPLTVLATTTIDQTSVDPELVVGNVMNYLKNDTLCYPATDDDKDVLRKQEKYWPRVLEFTGELLGGGIHRTTGITLGGGLKHDVATVSRAEEIVRSMDPWELTVLQSITMEAKSLLVGLAAVRGEFEAEELIGASRVEEEVNIEVWGLVEGGHDMDRLNNGVQVRAGLCFLDFIRDKNES